MKFYLILLLVFFFQACSFDNKTGIWNNVNEISKDAKGVLGQLESLSSANKPFNKTIPFSGKLNNDFVDEPITNYEWSDIFFNIRNNAINLKYRNTNKVTFKSKKITKNKLNEFFLFKNSEVIASDTKGNIIVYSINEEKIINKFNFYKKNFKGVKKFLNLIVEENTIYVSDNLGYLYAYNYKIDKILWAKNYKIPFRSNLKIIDNKLIASNQNNIIYFLNKKNGNILKLIPTEETIVKNNFINNFSSDGKLTFFLNTYGSLYAINNQNLNIIWFINLNRSLDLNPSNLFLGNQVISDKNKVVVSSNYFTYVLDSNNGSIIYKKNFSSKLKPLIYKDHLFSITKNNLLIATDLNSGEIVYSYNINKKIADFLNLKKHKTVDFKNFMIINNKIFIFLRNSYVLKFKITGDIEEIVKLPSKFNTHPIIVDKSLLIVDLKNRVTVID